MSDRTLTTSLVVGIVVVALVAAPALGASFDAGTATLDAQSDESPVPLAQQDDGNETNETNETTVANETTANQTNETADNETEQVNETEQEILGNETPGVRNVSVRRVFIDRLTLQSVVVRNATILEVILKQAALQNATNDTGLGNASIDRVAIVNATMQDVVLKNLTVFNDSLARVLFGPLVAGNATGNRTEVPQNVSLESYRIDSITLSDRVINGLFIRRAVVQSASLANRTEVAAELADDFPTLTDLPDRGNAPPEAKITGELGFYNPPTQDPDYAVAIGQAIVGNVTKAQLAAVGPEAAGPQPGANETTGANETEQVNETTLGNETANATTETAGNETADNETADNETADVSVNETTPANETAAAEGNETNTTNETAL